MILTGAFEFFFKVIVCEGVSVKKIKLHAFSGVQYRFNFECLLFIETSRLILNADHLIGVWMIQFYTETSF